MYKIGVIGDYGSIYGFASLGFDTFPVKAQEAGAKLEELAEGGYGIVYITEAYAAYSEEIIAKYEKKLLPAIILIPGFSGNTGKGIESVKKSVERAVGSDILFSKDA
jgi:V/A-type H+-transporting ATPase subunit F